MTVQEFSVFCRGYAFLLFEQAAEIKRVFVTDDGGDLIDVIVRCFQQAKT